MKELDAQMGWLEELGPRSRKVLNRRVLHDSGRKDSRKEIKDDTGYIP